VDTIMTGEDALAAGFGMFGAARLVVAGERRTVLAPTARPNVV